MKLVLPAALLAAGLILGSCANEGPTPEEVGDQLQRGFTGEGRLGPIDRSDDPFVDDRDSARPLPTP